MTQQKNPKVKNFKHLGGYSNRGNSIFGRFTLDFEDNNVTYIDFQFSRNRLQLVWKLERQSVDLHVVAVC
jgi:hypothetical protein